MMTAMSGKNRIIISTILLLLSTGLLHAGTSEVSDSRLPDLIEKIRPGVVNISSTVIMNKMAPGMEEFLFFRGVPRERKQSNLGSGFIIDTDGWKHNTP